MVMWCRKFIDNLPPLNSNSFVFLVSFLRDVLAQATYNRYVHFYVLNSDFHYLLYSFQDFLIAFYFFILSFILLTYAVEVVDDH